MFLTTKQILLIFFEIFLSLHFNVIVCVIWCSLFYPVKTTSMVAHSSSSSAWVWGKGTLRSSRSTWAAGGEPISTKPTQPNPANPTQPNQPNPAQAKPNNPTQPNPTQPNPAQTQPNQPTKKHSSKEGCQTWARETATQSWMVRVRWLLFPLFYLHNLDWISSALSSSPRRSFLCLSQKDISLDLNIGLTPWEGSRNAGWCRGGGAYRWGSICPRFCWDL